MSRYSRVLNRFMPEFMPERGAALKTFGVALVLSFIVGCATTNPVDHDYRLMVAPVSPDQIQTDLPDTLGVFPVHVPGWLDKKNITWSDGGVRLKTFDNDHWGEPLPALFTQTMVQNMRSLSGGKTWVSSGPWVRGQRPEIVAFINVQSISVVQHQLRVNVAWTLEGQDGRIIAQRGEVYGLQLDNGDSVQASVQTLSRIWGLIAENMILALSAVESMAKG